jgi:hypothetical protein|tara:strand:- start:179 stop:1018 length:840 start_codon:yes stop_codon:yes gene_type:complete
MKDASFLNVEFASKLFLVKQNRDYMTLFIDNIRLYKRDIAEVKESDKPVVNAMMETSDLLKLCGQFPEMKFVIFTNLEDTPLDEHIFDCIPDNVLRVCAANSMVWSEKVIPAPYGVQRRMHMNDDRIEVLKRYMEKDSKKVPRSFRLLYIGINENSHPDRKGLTEMFMDDAWASIDTGRVDYETFLDRMWRCKFVLCPRGNAIDCHRNWETIYMRRVPVMKRDPYLEKLYAPYPVLWVDDYSEVTEQLLIDNNQLFLDAQEADLSSLDLNNFFDKWKKP